jgi:hypothetical protein
VLLHEYLAAASVAGEGIGLAPGAVEREHQLAAQSIPERMCRDQQLELCQHLAVVAELEVRRDALLDALQSQLVQPVCRLACEGLDGQVGERWPSPQGKRPTEQRSRQPRAALGEGAPAVSEQRFEALRIQLALLDAEHVSRAPRHEPTRRQKATNIRDIQTQHTRRRIRRIVYPTTPRSAHPRHHRARPQKQRRKQSALSRRGQPDGRSADYNLQRAKHKKLHWRPPSPRAYADSMRAAATVPGLA